MNMTNSTENHCSVYIEDKKIKNSTKMAKWSIKRLLFPANVTPVDLKVVATLFYALLGNSLTLTMVFAYLPRLVKDFGVDEVEVGIHAGIVASSLFIGRTIGSYFWGLLADRFGRRTTLIASNILLAVFTLLFGFNWSLAWVTFARFMQGLVNGVVISAKASISDSCDNTNQSIVMGWVLSAFSLGLIIGPTLGGFLALPHEQFPTIFSEDSLFGKYPYLLPNLVAFLLIFSSVVLTYFILPETLKRKELVVNEDTPILEDKRSYNSYDDNMEKPDTVTGVLSQYEYRQLSEMFIVYSVRKDSHPTRSFSKSETSYLKSIEEEGIDDGVIQYNKVNVTFSKFHDKDQGCCSSCCARLRCCRPGKKSTFIELIKMKELSISVLLYGVFSFVAIAYDEILPVYASTSRRYNGLSFSTRQIGVLLLAQAVPNIVSMLFIAPKIEARLKGRKVYALSIYLFAFFIPLIPCCSKLPQNAVLWTVLIFILIGVRTSSALGFLAVNVLLNNSVEPHQLGVANGLGMAVSAFFRAMSPTIVGSIYSWSLGNEKIGFPLNYNFAFLLLSFLSVLTLGLLVCLPASIDMKKVTED